ncbi:hypothetical protein [Devosia sp. A369]
MVFRKLQRLASPGPAASEWDNDDPWDQKTLDHLKNTKMIDLQISHIERRFPRGDLVPSRSRREFWPEVVLSGHLEVLQHVHVRVEFNPDLSGFGDARLTFFADVESPSGPLNVPYLNIVIRDEAGQIRTGAVEALRDAIASGEPSIRARIWPSGYDWDRTSGGHGRTFEIGGMIIWSRLRSKDSAAWQGPIGEAVFDNYPSPHRLRRARTKS